jgi:predicted DNA repair protein MutK
MSGGLLALLDDVVAIAKVAAASIDDAAGQAVQVGGKAAGIVIDDAAVTPRYVVGFAADRELPIIARITVGSLKNKLLMLLPGALALSAFAPWAITPLLMAGGTFLCFEGYEKVHDLVFGHHEDDAEIEAAPSDPRALEDEKVAGAIRTDIILSAEIMAISLASVTAPTLVMKALVLAAVAIVVTFGVYGAVALIVKADDVGVSLAQNPRPIASVLGLRAAPGEPGALDRALAPVTKLVGRGLVKAMPGLLSTLSVIGALAMLWVGGGILVHGLAGYGYAGIEHALHHAAEVAAGAVPVGADAVAWLVTAAGSGVLGLVVGWVVAMVWTRVAPGGH